MSEWNWLAIEAMCLFPEGFPENPTLDRHITDHGRYNCSEASDKVYVFLGLADRSTFKSRRRDGQLLTVDYSKDTVWLSFRTLAVCYPETPVTFGLHLRQCLQIDLDDGRSIGRTTDYVQRNSGMLLDELNSTEFETNAREFCRLAHKSANNHEKKLAIDEFSLKDTPVTSYAGKPSFSTCHTMAEVGENDVVFIIEQYTEIFLIFRRDVLKKRILFQQGKVRYMYLGPGLRHNNWLFSLHEYKSRRDRLAPCLGLLQTYVRGDHSKGWVFKVPDETKSPRTFDVSFSWMELYCLTSAWSIPQWSAD